VTVKRFRKHRHGYALLPENPAYQPMLIDRNDENFRLAGRAIGVVRVLI